MSGISADTVAVEVSVTAAAWTLACPEAALLARTAAQVALTAAWPPAAAAVAGVILTDDAEQRQLNHTYRGKDAPTNVLSFAIADLASRPPAGVPLLLGDVVVAFETVARESAEQHKPLADHLRHLVVHGVLHLLGFDHEGDADAAAMESREIEILAAMGVPDPYRDTM